MSRWSRWRVLSAGHALRVTNDLVRALDASREEGHRPSIQEWNGRDWVEVKAAGIGPSLELLERSVKG